MARELDITINVDTGQAKRDLGGLEAALASAKLEAKKAGDQLDDLVGKFHRSSDAARAEMGPAIKAAGDEVAKTKAQVQAYNEEIKNLTKSTKDTAQSQNDLTAAFGRYLTAAAIIGAVKSTTEFANNLQRMSSQTGLSTDALQELNYASKLVNVSMDAVTNSISMMEKRIAEDGDKGAIGAVQRLGFNIDEVRQKGPEAFFDIAAAITAVQDPLAKTKLATEIFGRSGATLLPVFENLDKIRQEAHEVGAVMDKETIKSLGDLNNAIDTLTVRGKTLIGTFLVPATPALLQIAGAAQIAAGWFEKLAGFAMRLSGFSGFIDTLNSGIAYGQVLGGNVSMPNAPQGPAKALPTPLASGFAFDESNKQSVAMLSYLDTVERNLTNTYKDHRAALVKVTTATEDLTLASHNLSLTQAEMKISGLPVVGLLGDLSTAARDHMRDLQPLDATMLHFGTITLPNVTSSLKNASGGFKDFIGGLLGGLKGNLNFSNILSNMIGGGLSGLISGGLNAAVKGISSLFGKMFGGPSADELGARSTIADFQKQFGSFEQMSKAIGQAFVDTGHSAEEARIAIQNMLDSTHQNAAAATKAIQDLNNVLNEQQEDQKRAKELIQEYGISIEQLGPKFRAQQLNEQAKGLMNDFRLMVDVLGVDAPVAIDLMKDKMNAYVQAAIATGTEVPAQMKLMLQQMVDMGLLTDASGNKITNLQESGITFAETFSQGVDRIIAKFDELIQRMYGAAAAINTIPVEKSIKIITYHEDVQIGPADNQYAANGGLVTAHGIQYFGGGGHVLPFVPRGTDTVPAMLTPGELVLSRRDARAYMAGRGGGMNVSIGNISVGSGLSESETQDQVGKAVVGALRRKGFRFSNR